VYFDNVPHELSGMARESDAVPADALEDVAYLSRSANRVRILDALTRGPTTRRALAEGTGTSRTTLDRIVNELEERGWAERTADGDYVATTTGDRLMAEVRPFLESVQALRRLGDAVTWLPDDLSVGLHHFSDAAVRRPEGDDPIETVDYFVELAREADEIRVLTHLAAPMPLAQAMRDRLAAGESTARYVLTGDLVDYLADTEEHRTIWQDLLGAGARLYRYGDHIPCNLYVFGETVLVKKSRPGPIHDSYGVPIVTQDEAVRSWATDLVEQYRAGATRVGAERFADDQPVSRVESGDG